MLVFLIILAVISLLGILLSGKFGLRSPECRLIAFVIVGGSGCLLIYAMEMKRDKNVKDSIGKLVLEKRGELKRYYRVTSDGHDRRSNNRITDINSYYEVELKDGRMYIIGLSPEVFGDYFGTMVQINECNRKRG